MKLKRMLILSASFGEGHRQAANAIKELFQTYDPDVHIEIVDYIQTLNPTINRVAMFCYIQSIKRFPKMYGYFYKQVDRIQPSSRLHQHMNIIGRKKLLPYLLHYDPQVVINTFPTPAGAVSQLKKEGKINIPSITVITDYSIHSQWIHPLTDLYLAGSEEVKQQLLKLGIPRHKIAVTGIPVRQEFHKKHDKEQIRNSLGLDRNIPTVLIMGGAYGVSTHILSLCEQLFYAKEKVQVMVVCGRNKKLYEQMNLIAQKATNKALIFGFVHKVAELMAVSDLMFTKSGGLTTSEGVAMEIPMVFFRPIPGQEMANAQYLSKAGAAIITRDIDEIELVFSRLLNHSDQLIKMKQNIKRLKTMNHTEPLYEVIGNLLLQKK